MPGAMHPVDCPVLRQWMRRRADVGDGLGRAHSMSVSLVFKRGYSRHIPTSWYRCLRASKPLDVFCESRSLNSGWWVYSLVDVQRDLFLCFSVCGWMRNLPPWNGRLVSLLFMKLGIPLTPLRPSSLSRRSSSCRCADRSPSFRQRRTFNFSRLQHW